MLIMNTSSRLRNISLMARNFSVKKIIYNKRLNPVEDVPGLSAAVVNVPKEPVGPGAAKNTNYKNPEYFCYDKTSYFEAEREMLQFRCPQPSTKVPYHHKT